jgi:hypothetical protein
MVYMKSPYRSKFIKFIYRCPRVVKKLHNLFVIKDINFFFFLDDNYASTAYSENVAVYIQVSQYYKNNKAFDQCKNKYGVKFKKK